MSKIHTRAACLLLGILFSFSSCLSSEIPQNTSSIPLKGHETYSTFGNQKDYVEPKNNPPQKTSLFKNRRSVFIASAAGAIATTIALAALSQDFDPNVSQQFLNQTTIYDSILGTMPNDHYQQASMQWQGTVIPDSKCFDSFLSWTTSFWNHSRFSGDPYRGPSYTLFDETGQGHTIKGNLSEWITFVAHKGSCDFDALYQYVTSIFNATNVDPGILICHLNNNNETMCCGSAYTENSSPPEKHWNPLWDIDLRIVNASGLCAQNAEDNRWARNMGITGAIGAVATLLPWAISWFC